MGKPLVIKLGGSVGRDDTLPADVAELQRRGVDVVLIHGGGPQITRWLDRIGKQTHFVRGLRYTDEDTLDVVRMVLGGLVNGEVVGRLHTAGARAMGVSGSDDGLLQAEVRDPELGLVGEVVAVNPTPVTTLLAGGYVVVIAPLAMRTDGQFLNVNADTAAGEIARAVGADRLVFLTDVEGISDGSSLIRSLSAERAAELTAAGIISGGMIPKVEACLRAAELTGAAQIVDGRRPHILLDVLADPAGVGTSVSMH